MVVILESVIDILNCVYVNKNIFNFDKNVCVIMLEFFVRYMDIFEKNLSCKNKFRNLFFYCGLDNMLVVLLENDIIVLFDEMFECGIYIFGL